MDTDTDTDRGWDGDGNNTHLRDLVRQVYGDAVRSSYERPRSPHYSSTGRSENKLRGTSRGSGLGCGGPVALAELTEGESVIDLGSGMGYDCLAASIEVGRYGRVVGVDVTPEMVFRAQCNAMASGTPVVSFLVADLQCLPFPNACFDVVISNCVINLCPDKTRALAESHRVLQRGGRLAISDIVAVAPLPTWIIRDLSLCMGCVAGAPTVACLSTALHQAGFAAIHIDVREDRRDLIADWAPGRGLESYIAAADIVAVKS